MHMVQRDDALPGDDAVAGVAAVVLGAGVGEAVAALIAPGSSPFAAIGGALIDAAPAWAKNTAIALFGTADKAALLVGIAIVLLVVAAIAGALERRRPPVGRVILGAIGVAGAIAAVTRADAGAFAWLPSLVAGGVAVITLGALRRVGQRRRMQGLHGARARDASPASPSDPNVGADRRTFLLWSGAAVGVGVLAAIGSSLVRAGARSVAAVRSAIRLPAAAVAGPAIPAGADLQIAGLAPVITPNADFYRIDTALIVPQIDPATWRLRIHGKVDQEVEIGWEDLLALPLEESVTTLTCVSNEVGGDLIGTARWLGYPIRHLLARAGVQPGADMVLSTSQDGFTAGTPLEALTDERNAILAVGMNGEPLPDDHGFPVRMVVPGLYGYVSATKWVVELEVTRFADAQGYWTPRGWSELGPIKLASRIDVPRRGARLTAGDTVIAGVAWQQHVGVRGVQVRIDDGPWQDAVLAPAIGVDTWVQWTFPWNAPAGRHTITARAIGVDGQPQTEAVAPPAPDGATGWPSVAVDVG